MQRIEHFVVLMYSKGCGAAGVNEATLAREHSTNPSRAVSACEASDPSIQLYWHQALSAQQEIPEGLAEGYHEYLATAMDHP